MKTIPMHVHAITLDADSNSPILILKDESGERTLPIWIGLLEATAIATELESLEFARPMTHDLAVSLVEATGARIVQVVVTDLKENTYYAEIILEKGGERFSVDARPSDAVALALRSDAEILVNEEVLDKARPVDESAVQEPSVMQGERKEKDQEKWNKILEELDPSAFKYKM